MLIFITTSHRNLKLNLVLKAQFRLSTHKKPGREGRVRGRKRARKKVEIMGRDIIKRWVQQVSS
jgi:hypothetical protein